MRSLLIIEPQIEGHHGVYLRWLVKGALERGCQVQLATLPYCLEHPIFKSICEESRSSFKVVTVSSSAFHISDQETTFTWVKRDIHYYKLFGLLFRKASETELFDHVFVPYMDTCAYAMALLGSPFGKVPWSGIIMRPSFHYERLGIISPKSRLTFAKNKLFFRLLRNQFLNVLFTIDPTLLQYVNEKTPSLTRRLKYVTGPVNLVRSISKNEARGAMRIPSHAVVILVYGELSLRKGIDLLFAATQYEDFPRNVHLLLAGPQNKDITNLLQSRTVQKLRNAGRLHQLNSFLDEKQEKMVFAASDIVWLGYRNHYVMSGVLIQAGKMKLPVIACEEGVLGWLTKKHQLGVVVKVSNRSAVSKAVCSLTINNTVSNVFGENGHRLFSEHTPDQFISVIWNMVGKSVQPKNNYWREEQE